MKKLKTFALSLMLALTTFTAPQKSDAALLSLVAGPVPLYIGYGVLGLGGLGVGIGIKMELDFADAPAQQGYGLGMMILSTLAAGTIFLVLDEGENAKLEFQEISEEKAKELGLTKEELVSYNNELDQTNAIAEEIILDVNKAFSYVSKLNKEVAIKINRAIKKLWTTYIRDGLLSPTTASALNKIWKHNERR